MLKPSAVKGSRGSCRRTALLSALLKLLPSAIVAAVGELREAPNEAVVVRLLVSAAVGLLVLVRAIVRFQQGAPYGNAGRELSYNEDSWWGSSMARQWRETMTEGRGAYQGVSREAAVMSKPP